MLGIMNYEFFDIYLSFVKKIFLFITKRLNHKFVPQIVVKSHLPKMIEIDWLVFIYQYRRNHGKLIDPLNLQMMKRTKSDPEAHTYWTWTSKRFFSSFSSFQSKKIKKFRLLFEDYDPFSDRHTSINNIKELFIFINHLFVC